MSFEELLGLPSDFCNANRATVGIAVESTLLGIGVVVVAFRFFSRLRAPKGLMVDDYAMFIALFISILSFGVGIAETKYGMGKHLICIELQDLVNALRLLFISELLALLAIFFVKLSVTLFILKMGGLGKIVHIALLVNLVFMGLSTAAFVVELFVQCRPIAGNWDLDVMFTPQCLSPAAKIDVFYAASATSVLTDFCCVFLPLPIIWNLKMSRPTKISVTAIMSLGAFAGVCGIFRITQMSQVDDIEIIEDISWVIVPTAIWTAAELYVGLITGSLPACRSLFLHIVKKAGHRPSSPDENVRSDGTGESSRAHMLKSSHV